MYGSRFLMNAIGRAALTAISIIGALEMAHAADKITFTTDFGLYGRHAYISSPSRRDITRVKILM